MNTFNTKKSEDACFSAIDPYWAKGSAPCVDSIDPYWAGKASAHVSSIDPYWEKAVSKNGIKQTKGDLV